MYSKKHKKTISTTSNHLIKLVLGGLFAKRGPNRAPIQKVLYIFTVIGILSAVFSASGSTYSDVLADDVEDGLNSWIVGVCDSIQKQNQKHRCV